jgi:outer membrane protein OmpA-like peptidoglycan-associated protein
MHTVRIAVAALFGAVLAGPNADLAWGQSNPSADELIRSLTPTSPGGLSRGIHIVHPQAQGGGTGGVAPPADALPSANLYVLFATGSAELTPAAARTLDTLGTALIDPRLAGGRFRIEGHTDTVGSAESNQALSEARARAVVAYLASTYHVDPGKLEAVGLGQNGLRVPTGPNVPETLNRRVVVINLGG